MRHAIEIHQEKRGTVKDHIGDDVTGRRGHRNRCERTQRIVAQDHFVGKHQPRNWGIERRGNGRCHTTGNRNGTLMAQVKPQTPHQIPEHRAQIHQRAILPNRGTTTQRNQRREG